jgi:hypothetical protein
MKDGLFTVHHQCVAGVITALEADDNVRILSEEVDDFAFTFVSPLGADDRDVCH